MADSPGAADALARLEALRQAGAADRDPVRFAYLAALTRRAAGQAASIRATLQPKLVALANELATQPAPASIEAAPPLAPGLLADLLSHIGQPQQPPWPSSAVNPEKQQKSAIASGDKAPELKAVSIFRDDWSRLSIEQQLTQTLAQAPANAGPMNSQHLVLRSLERMRDLAPAYLQGFMSYVDTLIWLEHADPTRSPPGGPQHGDGRGKPRSARRKTLAN